MELFGRKPGVVWHDSKLGETLSMFKREKAHMAIVRDVEDQGEVSGWLGGWLGALLCSKMLYCALLCSTVLY
jgi:hypothetical protein